jgi:hypothetical protein
MERKEHHCPSALLPFVGYIEFEFLNLKTPKGSFSGFLNEILKFELRFAFLKSFRQRG